MKLLVLTGNAQRHRFIANTVAAEAGTALVVSECRPSDTAESLGRDASAIARHFRLRYEAERTWFAGHDAFTAPTLPILRGEVNLASTVEAVKAFGPDACVVFGASIVKEPLLSLLPGGRTVDLHLGLSPYYRGSGTNFWPFVNGELECVGSTLLHLDAGVDTGPIIAHVRPAIEPGDTVHTAGCKVIKASAEALVRVLQRLRQGQALPRVPQWPAGDGRYYRSRDFTEEALATYERNLAGGLIEQYLSRPHKPLKLIALDEKTMTPVAPAGREK